MKILIVDDDKDLREQLALACSSLGHQAEVVATAAMALERLQAAGDAPEVLLTDVRMPDMDGITLLRQLTQRGIEIPVVVISGHADQELTDRALHLGAVAFLEKPFGLAAIRDCLAAVSQPAAPK